MNDETTALAPIPPGDAYSPHRDANPTDATRSTRARTVRFGSSFRLNVDGPTQAFLRLRPATFVSVRDRLRVTHDVGCFANERRDDQTAVGSGLTICAHTKDLIDPDLDLVAAGARSSQLLDRTVLPPGSTQIDYAAEMTIDGLSDSMPANATAPMFHDLTPEDWWWLQPSRYCRPDELGEEAWRVFGGEVSADNPATGATVRSVCSYVNQEMQFEYGTTTSFTSATDSWYAKRGVCRDFNHIAVSFCRALNIPTRYAFGYLPEIEIEPSTAAMDFSAWFEVFLDGRWWTFDARVNEPRIGRIVVGRGRDAADVPMISTLGPALLTDFTVFADEITAAP